MKQCYSYCVIRHLFGTREIEKLPAMPVFRIMKITVDFTKSLVKAKPLYSIYTISSKNSRTS